MGGVLEASKSPLPLIYSCKEAAFISRCQLSFSSSLPVTTGQGYTQSELDLKESSVLRRKRKLVLVWVGVYHQECGDSEEFALEAVDAWVMVCLPFNMSPHLKNRWSESRWKTHISHKYISTIFFTTVWNYGRLEAVFLLQILSSRIVAHVKMQLYFDL